MKSCYFTFIVKNLHNFFLKCGIIFFSINTINAGCPGGDVTLTTQIEVDAFAADYHGCTAFPYNLLIDGAGINNLDSLIQLNSIDGNLVILNTGITTLTGLSNLVSVGGELSIFNNDNLSSLSGLNTLMSIGIELRISNNDLLSSLAGLASVISLVDLAIESNDNLTSLTGLNPFTSFGRLSIRSNKNLSSLTELSSITSIGRSLLIDDNDKITSLIPLSNLESVGEDLEITNMDMLSSLAGLHRITSVGRDIEIENNDQLVSLSGLNALTSVGRDIELVGNDKLSTVAGLSSLTSIGQGLKFINNDNLISLLGLNRIKSLNGVLIIDDNDKLVSLSGLNELKSVGQRLIISSNSNLSSLAGLNALTSIGQSLRIEDNPLLISLTALCNLISVGVEDFNDVLSISIQNNTALTSLSGIDNIQNIPSAVFILNNASLSTCHVASICEALEIVDFTVSNNVGSCLDNNALQAACGNTLPPLKCPDPCPLTCNDNVNASMPAEICELTFEPKYFLRGSATCDASGFNVVLSHPFGTNSSSPNYVDRTHLGYTFVYSVKDQSTGNSCWGYVTIEDKSGPPVPCKNATISCFQVGEINKVTNETEDACSGASSKVTLTTTWKDYGCDSATILGRVYRHIIATDAWGNASYCDDTLTIRKDVLDSVCCPSMVTLPCRMYALNGARLLSSLKSTTSIPFLQIFNSKNYDLYQFSNNKNSPFYPSPELLLNIQGHGDPLVEFGVTDGRISGTKLLLDNVVVPNAFFQGGINPESFAIHKDSLIVPAIKDSALDLNKTNTYININDELDEVNVYQEPNPNYCKPSPDKTLMYKPLGGLCKLVVTYNDEILPICGNGFKIRRQWRITDWCSGEEKICVQYIVVEDKDAPNVVISGAPNAPGPISSVVTGLKDTVYYLRTVKAHDCIAQFTINRMNTWDCNEVTQSYQFIYNDPAHPGKVVALNETVGAQGKSISLPVGVHIGRMNFRDACWNTCNFPILALIQDITPPNPVCDETTQVTLDPTTCWARVYAKDLDNGSRDNCCENLHFAIADMDSVEYYRKEYTDHIIKVCGWDGYSKRKTIHDFVVNEFISVWLFKDYIDLTECGNQQVVLRVFDNCKTYRYDPHVTRLSEHKWYTLQMYGLIPPFVNIGEITPEAMKGLELIYDLSAKQALDSFKTALKDEEDCEQLVSLKILSVITVAIKQYFPSLLPLNASNPNLQIIIDFFEDGLEALCIPEFKIKVNFEDLEEFFDDLGEDDFEGASAASGFIPFFASLCNSIYNECMINVILDDKTLPVCEAPDDIYWYCDNAGGGGNSRKLEYAHRTCRDWSYTNNSGDNIKDYTCRDKDGQPYGQIECLKENGSSDDILDPTEREFGYYGCGTVTGHEEEHGAPTNACDDNDYNRLQPQGNGSSEEEIDENIAQVFRGFSTWGPVYCHSWLCVDKSDQAGKIDAKSAFWSPELHSLGKTGPVAKAATTTNKFIVWDNCWMDTTYTTKDDQIVDQCGNGWLSRTWTFKDKCTGTITCTQKIYTYHRTDFEVMFPQDLTLNCDATGGTSPDATGRPMIWDDECELVGVNYEDVRFDIIPDACYKIVRTWKLIDWCKYDPNAVYRYPDVIWDDRGIASTDRPCVFTKLKDNGDGYMTYTQIIKVIDTTAPTTVKCKDTTICINTGYGGFGAESDPMCTVPNYNSEPFAATDNCTAPNLIEFRWELDADNDGTINVKSGAKKTNFNSSEVPNGLSMGVHKLYVISEDNCGQEDTTSCLITVKDCKKPTPYCYNGIATVIMPTSQSVVVWAKDLDAGSYDNCTKKADLTYSFGSNNATSDTFTCADIANGIEQQITVDIYVTDKAGNKDYCRTYLLIQDGSGNVCEDKAAIAGTIAGKVMTEATEPVENVLFEVKSNHAALPSYQTDAKGIYAFTNLDMKKDYSIIPKRDDDPTNGISTIDLVLLQKHIQGIEPLNSAYKVIAADVDRSNDISVVDLVELRKLILTIYDKLPNNTSWRFVPKSFSFSNISSPWGFQEKLDINSLSKDELNRDFVGVKVGDVNATAVAHSLLGAEARSGAQTLKFNTADRTLSAEEEAVLEFTSENFKGIAGYQFSLAMKGLDLKSVQSGLLKVNESNFGVTKLGQGYVTTSWNESRGITAGANDVLFSIKVKATKATILSEALLINSKYTRAEAYNNSETLNVALEVGNKKSAAGYALHQNTPNPFKATTVIGYELAKAGTVTMRITDVTGKLVRMYNQYGVKGYNQFKVNRSEISGAGVFYYTVETVSTGKGGKDFSAAKKMILVD